MTRESRQGKTATMQAARLHGPGDLRVEEVPVPKVPGRGQVLLRVGVTSICGSDLHSYLDGRIGDTPVASPLILGHEFSGQVEAVGTRARDGFFQPLMPGVRVAVDPAQPCGRCEWCERGQPNICPQIKFCGVYPVNGSLCEYMIMPARCCFPVPKSLDAVAAALLEPLAVALYAVEVAAPRVGERVAILGAGTIGLLILQLVKLAGAHPVYIADRFKWRLDLAQRFGGKVMASDDTVERIHKETKGRGVEVVIEAAWGREAVAQAAEVASPGARVVLVGISSDDQLAMKHSTARRKGLSFTVLRRTKHLYPRALELAERKLVDLHSLVTHRFPLAQAREAFALNAAYQDQVIKAVIEH